MESQFPALECEVGFRHEDRLPGDPIARWTVSHLDTLDAVQSDPPDDQIRLDILRDLLVDQQLLVGRGT